MSELKPCPFCGSEAKLRYETLLGGWLAGCSSGNCAASGRLSGAKEKTIAFWNCRQQDKVKSAQDGYTLISTELIDKFPEINMSNYGQDEVDALNSWGIEVVTAAAPVKDGA
jgi:hypothetical protein